MDMTELVPATEAEAERINKEKLMGDLRMVVADAEELLKATANQTGERIAAARAKAEESLKMAKVRMSEMQTEMLARTKAAAKATDDYVRENPWTAVGIAAAAGMVLGVLVARR
ncbi:MAG: DUF883 family protein [Sulfuricella sp.]|nr:DUF883 family protein [Sulfuricella sp.]